MTLTLMQKYTPKTLNDITLNEKALDTIIKFANSWMQGYPDMTRPALLLHGKSGTGKTMTVKALCNDCDFSIIEINVSSLRTSEHLMGLLKIPKVDFFGRKICLFLDEADSISSGDVIIKKAIMQIKFPVILAANNPFKVPKNLRDVAEEVKFWEPHVATLKQKLLKIDKMENLGLSKEIIDKAAETRDYRAAYQIIESKQMLSIKEKKMKYADYAKNIFYKEEDIQIKGRTNDEKKKLMSNILYYLEENSSKVYDILDLQEMLEMEIKTDKYIRRNQTKFASLSIKNVPKASIEIDEIKKPAFYEKDKKKFETN